MQVNVFISSEHCFPEINTILSTQNVYPCLDEDGSAIPELNSSNILVINGPFLRSEFKSDKAFNDIVSPHFNMETERDYLNLGVRFLGRQLSTADDIFSSVLDKCPSGTKFFLVKHDDNSSCIDYLVETYNSLKNSQLRYKEDRIIRRFGEDITNDNVRSIVSTAFENAWNTFNIDFSTNGAPADFINLSINSITGSGDDADSGLTSRVFTKP